MHAFVSAGDRSQATVVAHEVTHSWMGNLVSPTTWEHFWLNEGWTRFVETKIMERHEGKAIAHLKVLWPFAGRTPRLTLLYVAQ
eukprot:SAG11_NODE_27550_length_331_cov_1.047414_1_plen_83_part_10